MSHKREEKRNRRQEKERERRVWRLRRTFQLPAMSTPRSAIMVTGATARDDAVNGTVDGDQAARRVEVR